MGADVDAINAKIKQLEEDQYQFDKKLIATQCEEEEEEQYTNREMLGLSFMREDFKGEIKVLQLIDEQHDLLSCIKKERAQYLYGIEDERKNAKRKAESQIDELRLQLRKEVKQDDD